MLGAIIIVPAFGGTASAHHSNITASVACTGTVSWTATSWATGPSGTNKDIRVTTKISGKTTEIAKGEFKNANNYQFSGTFDWPAGIASLVITSTPNAPWGNGVVSNAGSSVTVSKPANCPVQPGVAKSVSCVNTAPGAGDGKIVVTLTNAAGPYGSSVTFKVFDVDQTTGGTKYRVASGETQPVTFTGLADGDHFVKILVDETDYTQSFTIDCDSSIPAVTNTVTCANGDGQVVVTLSNAGGEAVTFAVTDPKTNDVDYVTVNPNGSTIRTFSGFADGDYTITIKVGTTDYSQSFTIDCDHPAPSASSTVVCGTDNDGSVTITLVNDGTEAVVFHVTNPNTGKVKNLRVGIHGSTTVTYGGFSDGPHSVTITADGKDYTQSFTVHCDAPPTVSHTETCVNADGSVDVTMINKGDDVDAVFVLDGVSHTLAPGATLVVTLSGYADGNDQVVPLTINGEDKSFTINVSCDRPGEPAVAIAQTCATEDGVVVVTLSNVGGQLPLTFTVQNVSHVVPANSSVDVPVSGLLDGTQTINIKQGDTDFSKTVTIGCDLPPTADATQTCVEGDNGVADGQVVVTLHNNGDDVAVTFTVAGNDYSVGPESFKTVTIDGLTDGPDHVDVMVGDLDLGFDLDQAIACDHPGVGTVDVVADCVDNDGSVVVTLTATGGEKPVSFTLMGEVYSVDPDGKLDVTIDGLLDGPNSIAVSADGKALSFDTTTSCDLPPEFGYDQECANFDDTVTFLISNPGDDLDVTFTVNGLDYVLAPGAMQGVLIDGLADGDNTITLAINGVQQADIVVKSLCNPTFVVTAVCNSGSGEATTHWFSITNTESTDITVTWNDGSATVPAGQSIVVSTTSGSIVLEHNGQQIASANATEATCDRTVTFTKELAGSPATGETYSIRVSRLDGDTYVEVTTFDILAGESKVVHLPSTMDPAGIDYKFEEVVTGTASTSVVSPDQINVSGNLGETVNVVVTNGYASVQIDKTAFTSTVVPGGQITYTLQATNTGGLTLDPVVISDRLPSVTSLVSASVAGGAGQCVLTETTRPQLLTCTMSDALAPGAVSSVITLVVNVDSTAVAGSTIVNQAMVHGAYAADAVMTGLGNAGSGLSCVPVIASTVCDLSAQVGVPVSGALVASSPPAQPTQPTSAVNAVVVQLPRTGAAHLQQMLVLAFGGILLGGALLIGRRRISNR
ncbi:MAG: hypothetical protein ABI862_10545 [Ilumatobacteraceae bacterium]